MLPIAKASSWLPVFSTCLSLQIALSVHLFLFVSYSRSSPLYLTLSLCLSIAASLVHSECSLHLKSHSNLHGLVIFVDAC